VAGQPITRQLAKRIEGEGGDDVVLDLIASGSTLVSVAKTYGVSRETMRKWCNATPARKAAYLDAKSAQAGALVEEAGEILDNASTESGPDVQKAKSRAEHRRWLASKRDRAQYGDDAKLQIGVALDLSSLHLDALREVGRMPIQGEPIPVAEVELLDSGEGDGARPSVRSTPPDGERATEAGAEE